MFLLYMKAIAFIAKTSKVETHKPAFPLKKDANTFQCYIHDKMVREQIAT